MPYVCICTDSFQHRVYRLLKYRFLKIKPKFYKYPSRSCIFKFPIAAFIQWDVFTFFLGNYIYAASRHMDISNRITASLIHKIHKIEVHLRQTRKEEIEKRST